MLFCPHVISVQSMPPDVASEASNWCDYAHKKADRRREKGYVVGNAIVGVLRNGLDKLQKANVPVPEKKDGLGGVEPRHVA